jgi:hypothetical protein
VRNLLDRVRHPDVTYERIDVPAFSAQSSSVWAQPSVRYRMTRPMTLAGFRRATEYAGLLTVFERVS